LNQQLDKCPASIRLREPIFRGADLGLDVISTYLEETLAYAEKTILDTQPISTTTTG
jgi:hypothetical protein